MNIKFMKIKLDNCEKKVLNIYKKANPSISTNYKKKIKIMSDIFLDKLHFPLDKFKSLKIGDFACGSGEIAIFYRMCGHKVDGFDYNKVSIDYANNLKKKLRLTKINFHLKNLRDVKNLFNIVSCCAALHHLKNPYKVIRSLSKNVKPGGYLILSFGLLTSNFQHNLMKFISRFWGDNDNLIFKNSNILFSNHIKRAMKFGLRKKHQVIYDQFINPHHNYLDLKKVLNLLKGKFILNSMWPKNFIPEGDSAMNVSFLNKNYEIPQSNFYWATKSLDDFLIIKKNTNFKNYENFKKVAEYFNYPRNKKINSTHLLSNISKNLKQLSKVKKYFYNLDETVNQFFLEVDDIINYLMYKKPSIFEVKKKLNKYKFLFKGSCGLGINYFIFKKQ